jgi:hypothetical protein
MVGREPSARLLLIVFTAAIFLSAALLFSVQPLFAKMVLPRLGGSPAVWSVAMVFFQAALLLGYAYAHFLTRFLPGRLSVFIHLALMCVATLTLPLAIAAAWGRPPGGGEAFWLLGLFTVSIGLPFFALAANGPLLQAWFARTRHPAAGDPYFLYAASNVGSFLALIAYPLAIEPLTRLGQQARLWSFGFYALIVLIGGCGALLLRSPQASRPTNTDTAADVPPTWRDAFTWLALASVPSALLIAVTAHLSTDVAAAPLLWVVPLALYLATFVIVFQTRPLIPHWLMLAAQPIVVLVLVTLLAFGISRPIVAVMAVHLLAFFVSAMVCHGELVKRRPPARYLTTFYMWMSAGGMVGGIAAGLIAFKVFSWVAEYPLLVVIALLCRPGLRVPRGWRDKTFWAVLIAVGALLFAMPESIARLSPSDTLIAVVFGVVAAVAFLLHREALKLAGLTALLFGIAALQNTEDVRRTYIRSFFGVHKIYDTRDGEHRVLMHGTTLHGAQRLRDANGNPVKGRPEPLTYYHADSPLAQGIAAVRARKQGAPLRIGVVGLGAGTLACQTAPADTLHFYEIDEAVVHIAKERFTFVAQCKPEASIFMGDARLTIAEATDAFYDVLIVDAFSSDAIPIHLLTREAMAIYFRKMAPGGVVLMHVSNQNLELPSVVAGIARANDLVSLLSDSDEDDEDNYKFTSSVVAVARTEEDFASLGESEDWKESAPDSNQWVWTDDYSNIIGSIWRHLSR